MRIFVLSALLLLTWAARAETFFGPTTPQNRLIIATNEAIAITSNNLNVEDDLGVFVIRNGITNEVPIKGLIPGREPYLIAGPLELVNIEDESHGPLLLTFHRLTNTAVQSIVLRGGQTNVISLASNQTIHVLPTLGEVAVSAQRGTNLFAWESSSAAALEFTGPMTLRLAPSSESVLISYYFLENGFTLPGLRAAAGPTGSFEIAIEKSADLVHWSPVLLHQTTDSQKSFYRMRLSR